MMLSALRAHTRRCQAALAALDAVLEDVADDDLPDLEGARALIGLDDVSTQLDDIADRIGNSIDPAELTDVGV